jgi:hypothetical protein
MNDEYHNYVIINKPLMTLMTLIRLIRLIRLIYTDFY